MRDSSLTDTDRMNWLESGVEIRRDLIAAIGGKPCWWTIGKAPNYKRPRYWTAREAIDAAIKEEQAVEAKSASGSMMETIKTQVFTARQLEDYSLIRKELSRCHGDRDGQWAVLRRGATSPRARILYLGMRERAQERFNREAGAMRRGMVALVDPYGQVFQYATCLGS